MPSFGDLIDLVVNEMAKEGSNLPDNAGREWERIHKDIETTRFKRYRLEELKRQNDFTIGVFGAPFMTRHGFPMQLATITNKDRNYSEHELVFCDENNYNGINVFWRCDPEQDVVRRIFAITPSTINPNMFFKNFVYT